MITKVQSTTTNEAVRASLPSRLRSWRQKFVDRIEGKRVILVDGQQLTDLMIEHDIGVTTDTVYKLKEVSNDFFEDDV